VPPVRIVFFKDALGRLPVLDWLRALRFKDTRLYTRAGFLIQQLAGEGYAMRRPYADYLGQGLYELRFRSGHVQIRILYFFHGREAVVLSSVLRKEARIPEIELGRAALRKREFESNPVEHSHEEEL
jgi:phage-related protein